MKITIEINNNKYSVERDEFNPELVFDDFLNLLFISGVEPEELLQIINNTKQNHKKDESEAISNSCNL